VATLTDLIIHPDLVQMEEGQPLTRAPTSCIGPELALKHTTGLTIGGEVVAGERSTSHQNVTLGERHLYGSQPGLSDDVTLGAESGVLGPVTVGDHIAVAANAVVLADVPSDSLLGGIPARVLRTLVARTAES